MVKVKPTTVANQDKERVAGVILAAGLSSRMGQFKPLLPFGTQTVLEKVIAAFTAASVAPVIVVGGHRFNQLREIIANTTARAVFNPDYRQGMFSSVKAGLKALPQKATAFFVHPVDMPLVTTDIIGTLMRAHQVHPGNIIYPSHAGKRGRPPLIPMHLLPAILQAKDRGGLRAVLDMFSEHIIEIPVDDPGIFEDMDYPDDYHRLLHENSKIEPANIS